MIKTIAAAAIAVVAMTGVAQAETYECKLYQLPNSGFAPGAAASWHPEFATLEVNGKDSYLWLSHESPTGPGWGHETSARPRHSSGYDFSFRGYMGSRNFARGSLIKNNSLLIVGLGAKSGYQTATQARYNCTRKN